MLLCLSKPCTNIIMLDYICFLYLITTTTNKQQTHEICHCKGLKLYGKRQSSSLFFKKKQTK